MTFELTYTKFALSFSSCSSNSAFSRTYAVDSQPRKCGRVAQPRLRSGLDQKVPPSGQALRQERCKLRVRLGQGEDGSGRGCGTIAASVLEFHSAFETAVNAATAAEEALNAASAASTGSARVSASSTAPARASATTASARASASAASATINAAKLVG